MNVSICACVPMVRPRKLPSITGLTLHAADENPLPLEGATKPIAIAGRPYEYVVTPASRNTECPGYEVGLPSRL